SHQVGDASRVPQTNALEMRVEAVHEATPQLLAALARLLPQLNPKLRVPDLERLQRLIADPAATLLVATEGDEIVGTTTAIGYTTPFWIKARLDEIGRA